MHVGCTKLVRFPFHSVFPDDGIAQDRQFGPFDLIFDMLDSLIQRHLENFFSPL
jgi:hypothetical protein